MIATGVKLGVTANPSSAHIYHSIPFVVVFLLFFCLFFVYGTSLVHTMQACLFHQNTSYIRRIFLSVLMTKFSACIGNVPHDFNKELWT